MILFHVPQTSEVDIGMVITVWKGVKKPKVHPGEVPINSVAAFRAVVMEMVDTEDATRWRCHARSICTVVRPQALVAILDVEKCLLSMLNSIKSSARAFCKGLIFFLSCLYLFG